MATQGGPAKAVSVQSGGRQQGGPAIPVAVVSDGRAVEGGPAQPIYVVTSGPVQSGPAIPVVAAPAALAVAAGPAVPVYVVQGSLSGGVVPAQTYTQKVQALSPIAYWPLNESAGPTIQDASGNGRNGTYTNVTLGATGIGDGNTAATYNGTTSKGDVFSASLAAAINGSEGTIMAWGIVNAAGVWTDGATRQLLEIGDGAGNRLTLQKTTTNNQLALNYRAGAANAQTTITFSGLAFFHLALTWSVAANQVKAYINGAQSGATLTIPGAWGAAPTRAFIGSRTTTPNDVWSGSLAHVAVWNTPLSAAQIANLATV